MKAIDYLPCYFFEWCQHTFIGKFIVETTWIFAIVETIHIIGLCILLGTTLIVDLRLLGFGLRNSPVPQIARELEPWMLVTLAFTVASGVCLFFAEAVRLSNSGPFFFKMIFFSCAILIHFTIHWKAAMNGTGIGSRPWFGRLAAGLSICSWLMVALAGRGIAFLP